MNITKTLCLCAALSGAAGVQAMENREFVTQQDNTRVNNYQTNRPEASKRLFVSQEVERQIDHIKQLLTNAKLAWMFENLTLMHISEPTRRTPISYAVFCLQKK